MIYVVSGIHRSGTSMMMQALVSGGIRPFFSEKREAAMQTNNTDEYVVNRKFWEVGREEYMRLGFTSELPDEVCVKIQAIGLPILAAAKGYKIIYMRRDPEAIRQSYIKAFNEREFVREYPTWPTHYWHLLDGVKGIMQQRRDVEVLELQYEDVCADPVGAMRRVAAMGVPIDITNASATIKPELNRHATTTAV